MYSTGANNLLPKMLWLRFQKNCWVFKRRSLVLKCFWSLVQNRFFGRRANTSFEVYIHAYIHYIHTYLGMYVKQNPSPCEGFFAFQRSTTLADLSPNPSPCEGFLLFSPYQEAVTHWYMYVCFKSPLPVRGFEYNTYIHYIHTYIHTYMRKHVT